jgi:hypothetical protein
MMHIQIRVVDIIVYDMYDYAVVILTWIRFLLSVSKLRKTHRTQFFKTLLSVFALTNGKVISDF